MTLTGIEAPAILALRRDPRLLQIPSYLSAICVLVGIVWLLLLPLNEYSRQTYISENALLPGQVHTYFGGSEQRIFNAYVEEVKAMAGEEQQVYVGGQSISLRRTWLTDLVRKGDVETERDIEILRTKSGEPKVRV